MDAKLHGRQRNRKLTNRLPTQHVTGGVATCWSGARQAQAAAVVAASGGCTNAVLHLPAIAYKCAIACDPFDGAEVFKRTPYIADLKPAGRFVAKDLFDGGSVPLLIKTLLDNGFMQGECVAVTGCTMAETLKWPGIPTGSVRPTKLRSLRKARRRGNRREWGRDMFENKLSRSGRRATVPSPNPVGAAEKACYADI